MRHCAICKKGSIMAGTRKLLRGHYNPTNWTRKYPNLQKYKIEGGKRVLVCVQCLKSMAKPTRTAPKKVKKTVAAESPAS